ncbi:hypothetical protein PHISP_02663 [Aspergillus sp. HF37]|nr:hypothetical protein PHISP_02663 [Aspergillus sp. HF37]
MPPRRAHTKSRNGCDQCKKRRVKCNEQGPPCSNCVSRELHCSYSKAPTVRSPANTQSGSPAAVPSPRNLPGPASPLPAAVPSPGNLPGPASPLSAAASKCSPKSFGIRDLELMHKFSTDTYRSLCTEPSDHYAWQTILPHEAFDHDFLLKGVLALASLHIASTLEAPAALSYIDTALEYHNMSFGPYREAIDNLTPTNCDAVVGHSVITTVIGITIPRLTAEREESPNMTENITVVFELLKGLSNILRISRPLMKTRLFLSNSEYFKVNTNNLDPSTDAALGRLATLNDDTLASVDTEQHRINKSAISILRQCFCRFVDNGDAGSVLAWLAAGNKEFVHCLRCRKSFPMMILMHWGVLLDQLDGQIWWARNSGKALVSELLTALPHGDFRWEDARLWPKQKLGL